ncbi:hypothetical protein [Dictyobacter arantiisoli]|uniref:DUF3324 domain-containing protein n=1 Tax=Dictyobacter arantiisoli TaxID=2014874 RepID=A0A5A5THS3_9CHLR|nr:hypothetical protein [Dictyobacter arantiisoli]GCF10758.1 hypothetical protein KDI_43220 [Dictyobacter arantiisoli]
MLPGAPIERLQATNVSYDPHSPQQRLLIALSNTGTQLLHPFGSFHVLDDHGHVLQNIPLAMSGLLPQTSIAYPVYMQRTPLQPSQTYTAELTLHYEHGHALHFNTAFTVPQPQSQPSQVQLIQHLVTTPLVHALGLFSQLTLWHYVIVILLLSVAVGIWIWQRKKKHQCLHQAQKKSRR